MQYTTLETPIGTLLLAGSFGSDGAGQAEPTERLSVIGFPTGKMRLRPEPDWQHVPKAFPTARGQLSEYFEGHRTAFDLDLAPDGTEFQVAVWTALAEIPYGTTVSYKDIAQRIGKPTATRAVGAANGRNPLPIVLPCHRVVGADGSLTGFGGGLKTKQFLLELERAAIGDQKALAL